MTEPKPFSVCFANEQLVDLRDRLQDARWPEAQTVADWTQGVPLDYLRQLCDYWRNDYDFSRIANSLNRYAQFILPVAGTDIYFLHVVSKAAHAKPLLLTHGWPGSVLEFLKVIEPLTNPAPPDAPDSAFHLVVPALPGYGFSGKPSATGWGVAKIAAAWDQLMQQLGYSQYYAQGGDWGAAVTTEIARQNLGHCVGIHVNMPTAWPTKQARSNPGTEDELALTRARYYRDWDSGYSHQQATRPQTLGYALSDSPIAQAAWIVEKFYAWTDCDGHPENALSRDELLDTISLYWLSNSGASSARLYWESFGQQIKGRENEIHLPTGCSIFPKEIVPTPREWAEQRYKNIVYWRRLKKGGHFAAFEQPMLFVQEIRDCFRAIEKARS
ncbi:MAG: epoxide hydrolase family protein [Gammaproteobacteria bacterium]